MAVSERDSSSVYYYSRSPGEGKEGDHLDLIFNNHNFLPDSWFEQMDS